ncbi:MAG: OmpA family protein, partial [Bradyrhizobium sp.]|nr:OmpA family protein [Bradyrhizobium sp.]
MQAATIRPNAYSLIAHLVSIPRGSNHMTHLRLVLLATTALTAMQFAAPSSYAQTAPIVVAQADKDVGPDGKPKPKPAPPAAAPRPAAPPPAAAPPA